jgi:hypothetical protein
MEQKFVDLQSFISDKMNLDEFKFASDADNDAGRGESAQSDPKRLSETQNPPRQNVAGKRKPGKDDYTHTVRWSGESLSLIAKWYTGAVNNWRILAKSNPQLNPNLIMKGNVILIPADLLKTKEPLPQKVAAKYTSNYFAYTVKQDGEKMADIAKWYTGDSGNWKALVTANPKLDPDHLQAGHEIYIPPSLLKTRKPIPYVEVRPSLSKPVNESQVSEPQSSPVKDEEIELFGPKQFRKS